MAVETLTRTKCDRCKSVIEETPNPDGGEERESKPVIYVEQKGQPPIKFEDLCGKCTDRAANLCAQLRLEKEDKKQSSDGSADAKPKKATKGKTKKDNDNSAAGEAAPAL